MNIPDITTDAATLALWVALGTGVFAVLAEGWHARRTRRVARLASGRLVKLECGHASRRRCGCSR